MMATATPADAGTVEPTAVPTRVLDPATGSGRYLLLALISRIANCSMQTELQGD